MQMWPMLLRSKLKAARQYSELNNNNRNLPHATKCSNVYITFRHTNTNSIFKWLWVLTINAWLLITTTAVQGSTMAKSSLASPANYAGVIGNRKAEVALTELPNGYAAPTNYIKNYYQVRETEDNENIHRPTLLSMQQQQQQQQQQQPQLVATTNNAVGLRTELQTRNVDSTPAAADGGVIGRGFMDLTANNYGNSIVARGATGGGMGIGLGIGGAGGGSLYYQDAYNMHESGFVPTTFTPAGQHYASSLVSVPSANNNYNTAVASGLSSASTKNENDLQQNRQQYGNDQSNSNNVASDNNKSQQHSLFRQLPNYAGLFNDGDRVNNNNNDNGHPITIPKYTLAYADDGKQSAAMLQNYFNEQQYPYSTMVTQNDGAMRAQQQHAKQQNFVNYFPPTLATANTAVAVGYEIENPKNYYTFNNNYEYPSQQQQQELQQQQQQQYEQQFNLKQLAANTPNAMVPATYYQMYIEHKNNNENNDNDREQQRERQQQQQQQYNENNQHWQQHNQITSNYQQKQSAANRQQQNLIQEPETAETQHSARRIKKYSSSSSSSPSVSSFSSSASPSDSPKHKSKRSDITATEHNYSHKPQSYVVHENDIETESETDFDNSLQLEQLQQQLQQQQQQFIELQHQLIEHDQQLQIQKQLSHATPLSPASTPSTHHTLPPITHTVHHNAQSLQALSGVPLAKHTQVIKTIPMHQHHQVHVPYRQNVPVEVPDPVITTISKPTPIEIPVTRTVAVPNIQELKIPIEKLRPFPVERPIPYIVEKRVPYAVEKQIAKPVYYPVPIKVPILHTVVHKVHQPYHNQAYGHGGHYHQPHAYSHQSIHLPHTVYRTFHEHGGHGYGAHGHGGHGHGHHTHHYVK